MKIAVGFWRKLHSCERFDTILQVVDGRCRGGFELLIIHSCHQGFSCTPVQRREDILNKPLATRPFQVAVEFLVREDDDLRTERRRREDDHLPVVFENVGAPGDALGSDSKQFRRTWHGCVPFERKEGTGPSRPLSNFSQREISSTTLHPKDIQRSRVGNAPFLSSGMVRWTRWTRRRCRTPSSLL